MIRPDIHDLREFYGGHLGQTARQMLRRRLRAIWPDMRGLRLLGLGFATPFLNSYRDGAERVVAAMPALQGVVRWPSDGPSQVVLCDDADLPFPDNFFDRVLIAHELEHVDNLRAHLREVWRVLTSNGRVLIVAPNRAGVWSLLERTPFGHGRPFTTGQLSRLLRDNLFAPEKTEGALYFLPVKSRTLLRTAGWWEVIGEKLWPRFGGAVLIEAEKHIYGLIPARARRAFALRPAGA
jgi:SAM-dependent methyltransferase